MDAAGNRKRGGSDDAGKKPNKRPTRTRKPIPVPRTVSESETDEEMPPKPPASAPKAKDFTNGKDGGWVKPPAPPRMQRMKWGPAEDNQLLLVSRGREVHASEYPLISRLWTQAPTAKAIQERYTKLKAQQKALLAKLGIAMPNTAINPAIGGGEGEEEDRPDSPALSEEAADETEEPAKPKKTGLDLNLEEGVPLEVLFRAWQELQSRKTTADERAAGESLLGDVETGMDGADDEDEEPVYIEQ